MRWGGVRAGVQLGLQSARCGINRGTLHLSLVRAPLCSTSSRVLQLTSPEMAREFSSSWTLVTQSAREITVGASERERQLSETWLALQDCNRRTGLYSG